MATAPAAPATNVAALIGLPGSAVSAGGSCAACAGSGAGGGSGCGGGISVAVRSMVGAARFCGAGQRPRLAARFVALLGAFPVSCAYLPYAFPSA